MLLVGPSLSGESLRSSEKSRIEASSVKRALAPVLTLLLAISDRRASSPLPSTLTLRVLKADNPLARIGKNSGR